MSRVAPVTVNLYAAASSLPTRLAVACMLAMLAPCVSAQATSEEEELALAFGDKATISIATGSQQPLRRAPAVATVITAEDIRAMGATDLDEVLETVPGIHVSRNVQGYNPLYVIRGIYSEFNAQTLVLQNGVPLTMMFIGNRGNIWGGFPLENVARIEVIRGPGSALYGADAYAGVVNIITKSAADVDGTEFGSRAGSFNTWDAWAQHGGTAGALDVAAYVRVGQTDGMRETIEADAMSADPSVSLAPGPVNVGRKAMDANLELARGKAKFRAGYRLRDDVGTGGGAGSALDPVGKGRSERLNADLSWSDVDLGGDWRGGAMLSYFGYTTTYPTLLRIYPPGAFLNSFPQGMLGGPNTWERQTRASLVASYSGWAGHRLRLGVGYDDLDMYRTQEFRNFALIPNALPQPLGSVIESPVADSFSTPHQRKVSYVYVQDEWSFARDWALTTGVRHDDYSDFGGTTNPRLALVWDASIDVTAKVLYGRAFRAPSFSEQYSINNPILRGNPNLRPELINTLEASAAWQASADTHLQLSLFQYGMKDIIRTVNATRSNIGAQQGRGLELEASHEVARNLRLSGHYSYQRSIDSATRKDAGYAPHHHLYGRVDWGFANGVMVGGQFNHVASRYRAAGDTRPPVADYTTVDLTLGRKAVQAVGWEWALSVRNLLDADAKEPSLYSPESPAPVQIPNDLPLAGRSFLLQLIYKM